MQNPSTASETEKPRVLAIGDIHGCHVALNALLDSLDLRASDTVVFLGDVVDRGPGTRQVIDRILGLRSFCFTITIMGNHEEMFLDALEGGSMEQPWLIHGGQEAIDSYGKSYADVPTNHIAFMRSGLPFWETETEVFVHANLEPDVPLRKQSTEWLRWTRFQGDEPALATGQRVICGHTEQASGVPRVTDGWACIDTSAYRGMFLTCLDVTNDLVYQASFHGDTRQLKLSSLP